MNNQTSSPSILASLRAMIPRCELTFDDTKLVAERQAARLRQLLTQAGHDLSRGVDAAHLIALPRFRVVRESLPTDGLSYWNRGEWLIVLNGDQRATRQRFTLLHEFKHILDHGASHRLYRNDWEAERAADYFAACVLMPKPALKAAFCNLSQNLHWLAGHFGASKEAVAVRLQQIGLIDPPQVFTRQRCARPVSTPTWQEQRFRTVSTDYNRRWA